MKEKTEPGKAFRGFSGELFVIIAGVCWGLIGVFTRKMSESGLDAIQVTFLRNLFATIALLVVVVIWNREYLKFLLKDTWMFVGTGLCSIAFFNICYFKAIQMTSLSVAAVLLYTAPAMVVVLSRIFFKEKLSGKKILALFLAFSGCVCTTGILGTNPSISGIGMLIGLGSGLGYALYSIFGTIALKKYDTVTITFYTFFVATLGLLPFSRPTSVAGIVLKNPGIIGITICLAVFSTVLPFLCYTTGLKHMEAGKASIMAFIEPMVASICGIIIFKESLTISNLAGIALIFASLVLLNIHRKSEV